MTKLFLQCPNCKTINEKSINGSVSGKRLQELFRTSSNCCPKCLKDGVGKIVMNIIKFDWEKEAQPLNKSSIPIKVTATPEEITKNLQRELELRKSEKKSL